MCSQSIIIVIIITIAVIIIVVIILTVIVIVIVIIVVVIIVILLSHHLIISSSHHRPNPSTSCNPSLLDKELGKDAFLTFPAAGILLPTSNLPPHIPLVQDWINPAWPGTTLGTSGFGCCLMFCGTPCNGGFSCVGFGTPRTLILLFRL